jgi:hypothetical protein
LSYGRRWVRNEILLSTARTLYYLFWYDTFDTNKLFTSYYTSYAFNQQTRNKFLLGNEIYVMAKIYTVKKGKLDLSFYFTMIAALENPPDL